MKHLLVILALLLPVLARGQGAGSVAVVPTLADLATRVPSQLNPVVQVQGYRAIGDWGAGRPVRYNATSTNAVDNGCVFATVTGVGRWEAPDCDGGRINVRYFGAYGNGTSNDLNYLRAAVAKLVDGSTLYSPPGYVYRITDPVYVTNDRVRVEFSGSVLKLVSEDRVPALRVGPSADVAVSGMNFALDPTTNRVTGVPINTFAAGDMLLLYNLIQNPADYYPGQMAFVVSASGTEMVLDRFPDTALQVTNATRFVAPPDGVEVRNLGVDLSEAGDGIGISAIGRGHVIENCRVTGTGTTNDPNYIGIELRGQSITARGNYVNGILDADNTFDRSGYGIFAAGDGIVVDNNDISDCKHNISTSERRAVSPRLQILSNRLRLRKDWAALLAHPGAYLFLGSLDVHANVRTVEIRGNDIQASRLGLSLRNGDFDVINNRVEIVEQAGLPYIQIGNGFGEAFITRAVFSGNTFIAPTNASQFYWDHSDYGVAGVHRRMIWQGNTFIGAGLTVNDQEGALVNPFEDITFTGNIFERTNGTPLAIVGTASNVVISGNVFRYGGTGNGITLAIPTNPPLGREIFISGNTFVRQEGGTGFDIDATIATNVVALAINRWSPSTFSYVGPVHGIAPAVAVTMHDQRDTYPRVIGTYDGKLKFGTGEVQPYSSISLLYPGAIQTDGIWTVKVTDLSAPAFGTYFNAFSNYWNFVIRGDGMMAYRYSNEVDSVVATPIVVGPRRFEDLTNGVWRLSGNLGITSNAVPIVPETSTATLWLANAAANVRDLRIVWPDGIGGKVTGKLWHEYNDGTNSGLDADLLDGQHGAYYLSRTNHVGTQPSTTITGLGALSTLPDAPTNGSPHGRQDGTWVEVAPTNHGHVAASISGLGPLALTDAPTNGLLYGRQDGAWAEAAEAFHTHDAGDVVTGEFDPARLGTGTADTDTFLSGGGGGSQSWRQVLTNDVGGLSAWMATKSDTGHAHAASDVTSGTFVAGRLGTGTATTNTFLQGNGTNAPFWGTIPSTPSPTNGIADAPADGVFYGRKNNAWTQPDVADLSGISGFGLPWIDGTVVDEVDALDYLGLIGAGVATIDSPATYAVRVNSGGSASTRHRLNLIASGGLSLSISDDGVNDESDVTVTLPDASISYAKVANVSAGKILGRGASSGDGAMEAITVGGGLTMTGTTLHTNPVTVAASKLVGRGSAAGSGPSQEITLGTGLSMSGTTLNVAAGNSTVLGNTDTVTVPDTELTETTLIGTIRSGESATFGAGTLPTGSIIKVEAMGTLSAAGNWANGVLRVKFGSSRELAFTLLEGDSYTASGYAWRLTAWLSVTTAGASATTVLSGMLEYEYPNDADSPGVRRLRHLTGTASGTLDTTASNAFNLTWDNATGLEVDWTCNHLLVTRY